MSISSTCFCLAPSTINLPLTRSNIIQKSPASRTIFSKYVNLPTKSFCFSTKYIIQNVHNVSSQQNQIFPQINSVMSDMSTNDSFSKRNYQSTITSLATSSSNYLDSLSTPDPVIGGGNDINNRNNNGGNGGNGGNNGNDPNEDDENLPQDMRDALIYGSLTNEAISRYHLARKNPFIRLLLAIPAFRTRFLADSTFLFKLAVQELIGNGTALASEIVVRGKDVMDELEYVASDLIVGTVIEAAFVWILAPTLAVAVSGNQSYLQKWISALPSHMFQPSSALQTFSIPQRIASFLYGGIQYGMIGFAAGIVGTIITYGLIEGRKLIDKEYQPVRPLPAVLPNSVAWGAFMTLSSNTRFQIVEGLELAIANIFKGRMEDGVKAAIIGLRFANNYWGGVQFVQFFRYLGLHATAEDNAEKQE